MTGRFSLRTFLKLRPRQTEDQVFQGYTRKNRRLSNLTIAKSETLEWSVVFLKRLKVFEKRKCQRILSIILANLSTGDQQITRLFISSLCSQLPHLSHPRHNYFCAVCPSLSLNHQMYCVAMGRKKSGRGRRSNKQVHLCLPFFSLPPMMPHYQPTINKKPAAMSACFSLLRTICCAGEANERPSAKLGTRKKETASWGRLYPK